MGWRCLNESSRRHINRTRSARSPPLAVARQACAAQEPRAKQAMAGQRRKRPEGRLSLGAVLRATWRFIAQRAWSVGVRAEGEMPLTLTHTPRKEAIR